MPMQSAWLLATFAVFGCINLAIRPAERIAANEADVRKYGALLGKLNQLDPPALQQLLDEARQSDTTEVEHLRPIAFNDVALEVDAPEALIPLTRMQRLIGALA